RSKSWRYRIASVYWNAARNYGVNCITCFRLCPISETKGYERHDCNWIYPTNLLLRSDGRTWYFVWCSFSTTSSWGLYRPTSRYRWSTVYIINSNQNQCNEYLQ